MLGDLVLEACKLRGMSLSKACTAADLNYSTLHSQIKNGREIPFRTIDKLSQALSLQLEYFSTNKPSISVTPVKTNTAIQADAAKALSDLMTKQIAAMSNWGYQIGTDDVLDWLIAHDSCLVNHDWLIEKIDLFYPAKHGDQIVKPYRIGAESLAAKYFRLLKTDDYAEVVGNFDRDFLDAIVDAHASVADKRYMISDMVIDELIDGARVEGTYRRLLAPVKDTSGEQFTMVFSKLTQFSGG